MKVLERDFWPERFVEEIPDEVQKKDDDINRFIDLIKEKLQMPMTLRGENTAFDSNSYFLKQEKRGKRVPS